MKRIAFLLFAAAFAGCKIGCGEPAVKCTVSFDSQGGSKVAAQQVAFGESAARPADPVKNEAVFTGWFEEAACTNAWNFDERITCDMTLYAGWQAGKQANVYIVANGEKAAKYRKIQAFLNGTEIFSTSGDTPAYAGQIYVSGNDVYIAGCEYLPDEGMQGKIWKNGREFFVYEEMNGKLCSVFVVGNDVYTCGFFDKITPQGKLEIGKAWKNGQEIFTTQQEGSTTSIFVQGSDVYLAGCEIEGEVAVPKIWKNGVETRLPVYGKYNGYPESVCVENNRVYVAGYQSVGQTDAALFWADGIVRQLLGGSYSTRGYSVCAAGEDVYVAGVESDDSRTTAVVWHNGEAIRMDNAATTSYANAVCVSDGDYYVAGRSDYSGVVWMNGTEIFRIGEEFGYGYDIISICVVK